MEKVGMGLIGCGGMGRKVAKLLLKESPRIEVRGIFDPDKRAIQLALDNVSPSSEVYPDFKSLCRAPDVDWVMIASWNSFHKEHAVAALNAGKHVFCQKPLATTFNDTLAMQRAWERSGNLFTIGYSMRYMPHYRKIRELLDQGAIGKIVSFEFNETIAFGHGAAIMGNWRRLRRNSGGHLLEKCCHDIDMANWMVGSLPGRVASFGGLDFFIPANRKKYTKHVRRIPGRKYMNPFTSDKDVIDNQVAIIEYANGVRATFHASMNAEIRERRLYLCGTEGAIRADIKCGSIETCRLGSGWKIEKVSATAEGSHGGGDSILAQELARSMLEGIQPTAGFLDGLISATTCFAIDKAMETGRVVSLAPYWKRAGITD